MMITGLDLARLYSQGLLSRYIDEFDDSETLQHIVVLSDSMRKIVQENFAQGDEDTIDAFLATVEFPDIDHDRYRLLGLEKPE